MSRSLQLRSMFDWYEQPKTRRYRYFYYIKFEGLAQPVYGHGSDILRTRILTKKDMDPKEFNGLFKDLVAHLYDFSILETHPLIGMIALPTEFRGSRGEYFRELIQEEIERFKPEGKEHSLHAIEWRPYHILYQRYIEGSSLKELSQMLSLSERQLRRDNGRALQALASRIWERLTSLDSRVFSELAEEQEDQQAFKANLETLHLSNIIDGVAGVMENRIAAEGYQLVLSTDTKPIQVVVDRVIARQILISLISYFLNFPCKDEIHVEKGVGQARANIRIWSRLAEPWSQEDEYDHADLLESALYWSQRMNAIIEEDHPLPGKLGNIEVIFSIPLAKQPVILVVDDQKPTHQMFRRFLSRTAYQLVGVTDPGEVLTLARQLKPILITLDVMMPNVDGWEILQALKTTYETKEIPILVCSAWEEPELAKSLGAAGFLKKPIRQRDLLAALDRLNL
jgi:CheY-like chemotaxis protein